MLLSLKRNRGWPRRWSTHESRCAQLYRIGILIGLRRSRRLTELVHQGTSWLLAYAMLLLVFPFNIPVTARGIQCPTAAIQKVSVVTLERTPCGCLVKRVTERAPREGEKGFKQCRCAEKKAAEKQDQDKTNEVRQAPILFLNCSDLRHIRGTVLEPVRTTFDASRGVVTDLAFSPPTPPPKFI